MPPEGTPAEGEPVLPRLESEGRALAAVDAVTPLDGRYRRVVEKLAPYFSERALMSARLEVETEYLIALSEEPWGPRAFTPEERAQLRAIPDITVGEANTAKAIEVKGYGEIPATNHDVKAVEYFIREKLRDSSLEDSVEWTHWALTSEDANNLSYALMLRRATEEVMIPAAVSIRSSLLELADEHAALPMLARTHGQPATPTTFGKEFAVFAERIDRQLGQLIARPIRAKLNGASGNFNAHRAAFPDVDWPGFSRRFIERFNEEATIRLESNPLTTQIEPHDTYAELFDNVRRLNTVLIDFSQDVWRYVSDGWIKQRAVAGEVGSSTMPHKVNPIDFENAEGNLGVANALLEHLSRKLPVSRLQRDLSDSTVERTFGEAFGHALVGYSSITKGLGKIDVNAGRVAEALDAHPEVITEGIQVILRREGVADAYEQLKELSRGSQLTMADISGFIDRSGLPEHVKDELRRLTPESYVGLAEDLARGQSDAR